MNGEMDGWIWMDGGMDEWMVYSIERRGDDAWLDGEMKDG